MSEKKYDELEFDGDEVSVKFEGKEVDRVFAYELVKEFLKEQGWEVV